MSTIPQPDSNINPKKGLITDGLDASWRSLLKGGPTQNQIFAAGDKTDIKQHHIKDKFRAPDEKDLLNLKHKNLKAATDGTPGTVDWKKLLTDDPTVPPSSPSTVPLYDTSAGITAPPGTTPPWTQAASPSGSATLPGAATLPWATAAPPLGSAGATTSPHPPPGATPPGDKTPLGVDPNDPIWVRQKALQDMQDRNMQRQMDMQEQATRQQMMLSWIEHQKTMENMIRQTIAKLNQMEQEMRQAEHSSTMKAGEGWIKALG